jgi:glycosyltransferase involved in cell wall biosynthesis
VLSGSRQRDNGEIGAALAVVLQNTDCHLVVVGEGERGQQLTERIRRLGIEEHVRRTGYLSSSALSHEYRRAAIVVLPSC